MLRLNTEAAFADCEEVIGAVSDAESQTLRLATNLRMRGRPCGSVALAQALISWARHQPQSKLVTYLQSGAETEGLKNLAGSEFGLVGIMMSADVVATDGATSIRREAYEAVRQRIKAMSLGRLSDTAKGVAASLICVDHSSLAYLDSFYRGAALGHQLRSESDFRSLTSRLLDVAVPQASRKLIGASDVAAIGTALRELFANTHDHARTNADGQPWRKSVRGVFASHYQIKIDQLQNSTRGLDPLYHYMRAHGERIDDEHIQFFEVSVYDSGPGFAARRLGRQLEASSSIRSEYEAVATCFLKHVSTKSRPTDGLGLYRIMGLLKRQQGFLRLRTGRLSLFKSFVPGTFEKNDLTAADLVLRDVSSGSEDPSAQARAEGAAVSVILPVGRGAR